MFDYRVTMLMDSDGCMDGWKDGPTGGWTGGSINGWMVECTEEVRKWSCRLIDGWIEEEKGR